MARVVDPEERELAALGRLVTVAGKDLLDIGCGDGRTTRRLARTAASVLGVDPDPESIVRAREAASGAEGGTCAFLTADVVTLVLAPASYDVVVFSRSL